MTHVIEWLSVDLHGHGRGCFLLVVVLGAAEQAVEEAANFFVGEGTCAGLNEIGATRSE